MSKTRSYERETHSRHQRQRYPRFFAVVAALVTRAFIENGKCFSIRCFCAFEKGKKLNSNRFGLVPRKNKVSRCAVVTVAADDYYGSPISNADPSETKYRGHRRRFGVTLSGGARSPAVHHIENFRTTEEGSGAEEGPGPRGINQVIPA